MGFFPSWEKEHLTKGTKILRIKPQVGAVKGIRIKHSKHMPEAAALLQARPHCHLLNKNALLLGLVCPECFREIHSAKRDHSVFPLSLGAVAPGQEAPLCEAATPSSGAPTYQRELGSHWIERSAISH